MNGASGRGVIRHGLVIGLMLAWTFTVYSSATLVADVGFGHRGRPPLWVLMVATLFVALSLPRIKPRAERLANWLAFGERADAYEVVTNFVSRVANAMSVDDVLPRLAETAARSVHSDRGEVRLWLADGAEWRQVWPPDTSGDSSPVTVEVRHRGTTLGEIGVDPSGANLAPSDRRVLDELAGPAGLALSTVRNTFELRERLAQLAALNAALQASQQRLIEARRVEQHRLQSQVDTVVGPHLHATEQTLVSAERAIRSGTSDASALLGTARLEAVAAIEALRQLARGIFPPVLADAGIVAALEAWGDQSTLALSVHVKGDLSAIRAQPAAEAALYFSGVTVLGALSGHDPSMATATVEIQADDDGVRLSVVSALGSGSSFPPDTVQALRDRVEALAGTLDIAETGGGLVTLDAWVPTADEQGQDLA